ncbi:hypothetical protein ACFY5A_08385 [Microbacterium sp. NPDC012755]|uniref:hypothetical protein n=1 Tax=Microbacterium sp. NPDC012755 TaxID=3364184 RepID=UPI0036B1F55D
MRSIAVVVGGLLVIGGGVLVVSADQQRVAALQEAKTAVEDARGEVAELRTANHGLSEKLAALRSRIAEQDAQLSDVTGFLQ